MLSSLSLVRFLCVSALTRVERRSHDFIIVNDHPSSHIVETSKRGQEWLPSAYHNINPIHAISTIRSTLLGSYSPSSKLLSTAITPSSDWLLPI
ncbi:hypothetical protein PRIPAC_96921 [Pristionchus pacificus]|uniref:Uncharacterized protein n=1 Tax=Pristionchus pacificus TaxID=54126 RepID=A0A2A6BCK0_PRIPA|nr:hypothetical protein PRIPAC_96921 [Pristionchus pacificus]|eukprot:PDM63576.1 hypothetical protein PRIPAC_49549 [Pristionchus pacificus]